MRRQLAEAAGMILDGLGTIDTEAQPDPVINPGR
jgi:hypothetical protein